MPVAFARLSKNFLLDSSWRFSAHDVFLQSSPYLPHSDKTVPHEFSPVVFALLYLVAHGRRLDICRIFSIRVLTVLRLDWGRTAELAIKGKVQ